MDGSESFNLHETIQTVSQACQAVICHTFFDAGLHGLVMAMCLGLLGLVLFKRRHRLGQPMMKVCLRISIFCLVLMLPGAVCLAMSGHLPSTGVFSINSVGFIVFWSLLCVHFSAEEVNHQWF